MSVVSAKRRFLSYVFIILSLLKETLTLCPEVCTCKKSTENVQTLRVKCGGNSEQILTSIRDLDFGNDAVNIFSIDFSKNTIGSVGQDDFRNLTEIKRLDLSSNNLQQIDKDTFGNSLINLERLKLSNDSISHIYSGSFDSMPKLKFLDISYNPLVCDCDLTWLLGWSKKHSIKLQPPVKCDSPVDFKGTPLNKLKVGVHLHCESPMQPLLELFPNENQVAFEGDELVIKCEAPRVALGVPRESEDLPMRANWGFYWGWSETIRYQNSTEDIVFRDPTKEFSDVFLEIMHTTPDSGILYSMIRIARITKSHRGTWDCTLRSQQANLSKSIAVHVISKSTEYCKAVNVKTNKGHYYWPQTVRGETVVQSCQEDKSVSTEQSASYHCDKDGVWSNLNTESCAFVSPSTRILEEFANLNFTATNLDDGLQIAERLHNFTDSNLLRLKDPIDLEFIARTLLKYHDLSYSNNELPLLQLAVVSKILVLPTHLWYNAQKMYRTGIKILNAAEYAAEKLHTAVTVTTTTEEETHHDLIPLLTPKNVFIQYFNIQIDSFAGITCILFRTGLHSNTKRMFDCSTSNDSFPVFDKSIEAAIQIPLSLLFGENEHNKSLRLMLAGYRNANLLPYIHTNDSKGTKDTHTPDYLLSSPIIGCKVFMFGDNADRTENIFSKDKINVILRAHPYHNPVSEPVPSWWDSESNTWNSKVCEKLYLHRGLVMFSCSRFGYYGLLQQKNYLNDFVDEDAGAKFHFAPLGIYIGCAIIFICSWVNIVTYVTFRKTINMNCQQRHSLVNTWLALSSLCVTFSVGIHQTERAEVCRIFGLLIHYFTLCVLLWISVNLSTMYKRLSKTHRVLVDSDFPKDGTLKKPILGIYLVGWGIAMIICGISSAVNINEYASYHFCFLHNSSALNALIVPAAILMVFIGILILCTYYHLNKDAVNMLNTNQFSDNTQTTENIDLDLFDNATQNCTRRTNTKSTNLEQYSTLSNPLSSIVDDYERSNIAHVRANLVFLLLFLIAWVSAATYVVESAEGVMKNFVHNFIFATSCGMLGLFLLLFYTLSRNDTRNSWGQSSCRLKMGKRKNHSNSFAPSTMVDNTVVAYKAANTYDTNNSGSRSNSQCSKQRASSVLSMKSGSHTNERLRHSPAPQQQQQPMMGAGVIGAAAGGTPGMTSLSTIINNQTPKVTGINSAINHDIPSAEIFYNPNQINVARKFFKKQKRLAKRNNFEIQRQMDRSQFSTVDSDASSSAYSKRHNAMTLLAGGSKINNTNIHYKNNFQNYGQSKGDSPSNNDLLAMRKNANHSFGRGSSSSVDYAQNSHNNMVANIYTNIPETLTPKHEIYKVRSTSRNSKPLHLETTLNEHDELEQDEEDNSSHDDMVPLYVNTHTPNTKITFTKQLDYSRPLQVLRPTTSTPIANASVEVNEQHSACGMSFNETEVEAMNSLGLPENEIKINEDSSLEHAADIDPPPDLEKKTVYVSAALQITDCVEVDEEFSPVYIRHLVSQKQSKSLNNIHDVFEISQTKGVIKNSSSQQTLLRTETSTTDCGVNEHKSLELLEHIEQSVQDSERRTAYKLKQTDTCQSSSPTNESDLNYQNSEISIRSHGLYAPQADNDLNLTITDDFPYQSSNASDMEDGINDFDDEFACFSDAGGCAVGGRTISGGDDIHDVESLNSDSMHASIDELYEAIKRNNSNTTTSATFTNQTPETLSNHLADNIKTDDHNNKYLNSPHLHLNSHSHESSSTLTYATPTSIRENLNETFEEDSSQSSVISYIDPKANTKGSSNDSQALS